MRTPTNKPVDLDCATPRRRTRLAAVKTANAKIVAITGLAVALAMAANATSPVTPPATTQSRSSIVATSDSHGSGRIVILPHGPLARPTGDPVGQPGTTGTRDRSSLGEERRVLIGLLLLCFAVMSIGGFGLWRRGMADLLQSRSINDGR
jgi:hypothetical protein